MIARLTYADAALGAVAATLSDDAVWTCTDPDMEPTLNAMVAAEDRSPARGDWLAWHAEKMAKMLDAEIEFEDKDETTRKDTRY